MILMFDSSLILFRGDDKPSECLRLEDTISQTASVRYLSQLRAYQESRTSPLELFILKVTETSSITIFPRQELSNCSPFLKKPENHIWCKICPLDNPMNVLTKYSYSVTFSIRSARQQLSSSLCQLPIPSNMTNAYDQL